MFSFSSMMNYRNNVDIIDEQISLINIELHEINQNLSKINKDLKDLKSSLFMGKQELKKLKNLSQNKLKIEKRKEKLEKEKTEKMKEKERIQEEERREFQQEEEERRQEEETRRIQEEERAQKEEEERRQEKNQQIKLKKKQIELKKQRRERAMEIERKVKEKRQHEAIKMGEENTRSKINQIKRMEENREKLLMRAEENGQREGRERNEMGEANNNSKKLQTERMEENREEIKKIFISKKNNNILCEELKKTLSSFSLENIPNIQKKGHYFIDNEGKQIIKNINNNEIKKNPYYYANKHGYTFKETLLTNINKTNEINELNGVLCKLFIIIGFINNYELKDDKFMILLKGKRAIQYLLKNKIYNIKTTDIDILIKYKNEEYQYDELESYEKTIYIGNLITELLNNNKIRFSMDSLSGIEKINNINNKKEFIKQKRKEWNELNNKRRTFNPYIFKILYNGSPIMDIDMRDIKHETKIHFKNIKKDYIQLKLSNGKIIDLLYFTQKFDQLLNETNYYLRSSDLTNYNRNKLTKKINQMKNIRNKELL